jgi:hypothetical protein
MLRKSAACMGYWIRRCLWPLMACVDVARCNNTCENSDNERAVRDSFLRLVTTSLNMKHVGASGKLIILRQFKPIFFRPGSHVSHFLGRARSGIVQGDSNITGTDLYMFTHKSVPVIFEPPCICGWENPGGLTSYILVSVLVAMTYVHVVTANPSGSAAAPLYRSISLVV